MTTRRKSQNFLPTMTREHQTDEQPANTEHWIHKSIERVHGRRGCTISIFAVKIAYAKRLRRLLMMLRVFDSALCRF